MGTEDTQSNNQEFETPQFFTQSGMKTINLGEEIRSSSLVNTPKIRFQPNKN